MSIAVADRDVQPNTHSRNFSHFDPEESLFGASEHTLRFPNTGPKQDVISIVQPLTVRTHKVKVFKWN